MPRKVDYGSRFAFLREAAFEVVLTRGVDALSRQSVADAQGVSASTIRRLVSADADLLVLAAQEVETRRRRGRWQPPAQAPRQRAVDQLRRLVPDTDERIAEELVWMRIVFSPEARAAAVPAPAADGTLRERYAIALRGFADETATGGSSGECQASPELTARVEDRSIEVSEALVAVVDLFDVPDSDRRSRLEDLRLLVDGICLGVCSGRVRPGEAVRAIERSVDRLEG